MKRLIEAHNAAREIWKARLFKPQPISAVAYRAEQRRRSTTQVHYAVHNPLLPFPGPMRECPICRFGEGEWRFWEDPIKYLTSWDVWEDFWDWVVDGVDGVVEMKETDEEIEARTRYELLREFGSITMAPEEPRPPSYWTDVQI